MLKRIRGARVSFRTFVVVVAIALLAWAAVVYVQVRDFVPEDLVESSETVEGSSPP